MIFCNLINRPRRYFEDGKKVIPKRRVAGKRSKRSWRTISWKKRHWSLKLASILNLIFYNWSLQDAEKKEEERLRRLQEKQETMKNQVTGEKLVLQTDPDVEVCRCLNHVTRLWRHHMFIDSSSVRWNYETTSSWRSPIYLGQCDRIDRTVWQQLIRRRLHPCSLYGTRQNSSGSHVSVSRCSSHFTEHHSDNCVCKHGTQL